VGVLSWVLFGLFAGFVGRMILPGRQRIGLFWTVVVGVAGAGIGGYFATEALGVGDRDGFDLGSLLIAAGTSVILLVLWDRVDRALPARERRKEGESWFRYLSR
jgi:uncharacterized membrane protein YeaQ/YmgE (transglycosylase-associated protein family)